jgi:hypothetical protein
MFEDLSCPLTSALSPGGGEGVELGEEFGDARDVGFDADHADVGMQPGLRDQVLTGTEADFKPNFEGVLEIVRGGAAWFQPKSQLGEQRAHQIFLTRAQGRAFTAPEKLLCVDCLTHLDGSHRRCTATVNSLGGFIRPHAL